MILGIEMSLQKNQLFPEQDKNVRVQTSNESLHDLHDLRRPLKCKYGFEVSIHFLENFWRDQLQCAKKIEAQP